MNSDKPFLGMLFMLGFCALAPLGDGLAKLLGDYVTVLVLVLARFAAQAVLLTPLTLMNRQVLRIPTSLWPRVVLRTLLHVVGLWLMFTSLRYLPLADALAIAFVMPFIVLLLGHFAMDEMVGRFRLTACGVGFIGTLFVIQPNFLTVGWPALLPLGVAVVFALFMMITRQIAKDIDVIALQAISGWQAVIILTAAIRLFPDLPGFAVAWPDVWTAWMLLLVGVLGTVAHLMMTVSLRLAPAATLAPMQYLEIPFGTLIGWLLFRDLPNGLAAIGIIITVLAGLAIILREQHQSRSPNGPAAKS